MHTATSGHVAMPVVLGCVTPRHTVTQISCNLPCRLAKRGVSRCQPHLCSPLGFSHPTSPSNATTQLWQWQPFKGRGGRRCGRAPVAGAGAPGSTEPGAGDSAWKRPQHEKEAELLFRSAQHEARPQVGAEYGEGFVQFRLSGSTQLDVESLNERLKSNGAIRMRHSMRPDEQYGMVFMFDGVIADTRALQQRAWQRLAEEEGLQLPVEDRHLFDVRAERVITEVLGWTRDWGRAQQLAWRLAVLYAAEFQALEEPLAAVKPWLLALQKAAVPCALVSHMPAAQLKAVLERMGLESFFGLRVTAEDDMETLAERLLSASLKLQRPPNHCVVFVASPSAITAAHNCTMKAVALQGHPHPGYQLKQADLTLAALDELTVYNIRRLFAQRGAEFMDIQTAQMGKPPRQSRTVSGTM